MTQRLLLPNKTRSKAGVELVPGAILEALDFLEIKKPVQIKWTNGTKTRGSRRFTRDGEAHVVTISTYWPTDAINNTLWHELFHAHQAERYEDPAAWTRAYRREGKTGRAYQANKYEAEANEAAEWLQHEIRLTKPGVGTELVMPQQTALNEANDALNRALDEALARRHPLKAMLQGGTG